MQESHFIIPRRYSPIEVTTDIDQRHLEKHAIAALLAIKNLHMPFQWLLDQPTNVALEQINQVVRIDPSLRTAHARNFPNKYRLPQDLATYLLGVVYNDAEAGAKVARKLGLPFNMQAPGAIIVRLIMAGANPLVVLARPDVTARDIDSYLGYSPAGAKRDYNGYTIAHAHCLDEDFLDKKLPVLLKHRVDINSTTVPFGTILHAMLANEHLDEALAYVQLPSVQRWLEPAKRDGEKKTTPIIAAKVRAEAVLLALADLYPNKLAINAQDDQGCTVMHYIYGLGLTKVAYRYAELDPNMDIKDNKGRKPVDYLDLTPRETADILYSIEIHPYRDAGAQRNAIIGQKIGARPVLIDDKPQLMATENFTGQLLDEAYAQFGEEGLHLLNEQQSRLCHISVLEDVLENRAKLRHDHKNGLIAPSQAAIRDGTSNPSSDPS